MQASVRMRTKPMSSRRREKANGKKPFDAQEFLESAGVARKVVEFKRKDTIFSQGDSGKTVLYIQKGGVRLSVVNQRGKEDTSEKVLPKISQEMLAEMVGTTRSRVNFFMNKFRALGLISYSSGSLQINKSLLSVVLHE